MPASTLTRALLRVGLVVILVWLAVSLVDVLLLVFAGLLLAVLLRAPADWLGAHTRLSSFWWQIVVLVALAGGLGGTIWALAPEVGRQFDELIAQVPAAVRQVTTSLEDYRWGRWLLERARNAGELLSRPGAMQGAGRVLSSTFGALAAFFVLLVVGLWIALQPRVYIDNALRLFPVGERARARAIGGECVHALQRWLVGKLVSMTVIGVATWIGLWALDVPLALVLALLAGALAFIPNFGPILAATPAILLGLTQGYETALWVAALYVAVQAVDNTAITPLIQRQAVSLPPAVTIVAQTVMGALVGPLGLIVATPLTAVVLLLTRRLYVDRLEADGARTGLILTSSGQAAADGPHGDPST